MSTVARISLTDGRVTAESHIWIIQNGAFEVASGPVPEFDEHELKAGPHRVAGGLAALGWRAVDYYSQRAMPNGIEIDVVPLEGGTR
jgi:hypothetical protein